MILAIDPGAKGALAFLNPEAGTLEIVDTPTVEVKRGAKMKTEISAQMLASIIRARKPTEAVVERVGAFPGQGVSSVFAFGKAAGLLDGVLAALEIPVTYVAPQKWQRDVGAREGKDGNRQRAAELFPAYASSFSRAKDDGRADAALMAWWRASNG
jgi:crossover junction endodeoxyribonuclease RuvC